MQALRASATTMILATSLGRAALVPARKRVSLRRAARRVGGATRPFLTAAMGVRAMTRLTLWLHVLLGLTACALPRSPELGLQIGLGAVAIPAASAHRAFQGGRPVGAASSYAPFCELEITTISEQPQQVRPVRARITRVTQALLQDPITRIPALLVGIDCSDPVFQESVWWLAPEEPSPVLWLRCLTPYFECRIGGPPSLSQAKAVMGPTLVLGGGAPTTPTSH